MINAGKSVVQFGSGDVGMKIGIEKKEGGSTAVILFYNQEKSPIHGIADDYQFGKPVNQKVDLSENLLMKFSNPESIDAVISVLNAAKRVVFERTAERRDPAILSEKYQEVS